MLKPATRQALGLFHRGSMALSEMEMVGMPVNVAKLRENSKAIGAKIREVEAQLRNEDVYMMQRRRFGKDANIGSRPQLGQVLFEDLKVPIKKQRNKNGKWKLDDAVLASIELPYITAFRQLEKLKKLKSTYLDGLLAEEVNGRVHGFLGLHKVKTFRGSAEKPNLNNLPTRNRFISKYVKSCIEPKEGWYIVESDFSALEVHVAACYHKDPVMIEYLQSGYDMHTDVSKECYMYDDTWIKGNKALAKELRTAAKSDFTFGAFYGNWYVDIANRLWKTAVGKDILGHLWSKGIKRLGLYQEEAGGPWIEQPGTDTFVSHIKKVEHDFWNKRFGVYNRWRKDWYSNYLRNGWFQTLTGFTWWGVEKRNFIINCPIQGSAFHCLLQSIVDITDEIKKRKMKSELFLEIHDSVLAHVPANELHDYVAMSTDIMTTKLREKWPWLIIDLKTEVECSPVSWHDKVCYTGKER